MFYLEAMPWKRYQACQEDFSINKGIMIFFFLLLDRKLPIEEVQKSFEPHRTSLVPLPHQQKTRYSHCVLQGIVCLEFFHRRHEYQMEGVIPIRYKSFFLLK